MENVKKTSLKTEFFTAVTVTLVIVALASAATVWGCLRLQQWLVPDTNYVMVHMGLRTPEGVEVLQSTRCEVDGGANWPNSLHITMNGAPEPETYDIGDLILSVESVDYGIGRNGPRRKLAYIGAGAAMGVLPAAYSVAGVSLCAVWFYRRKLAPAITALDDAARHIREQDLDFTVSCPLSNELGRLCGSFEQMRQALCENNLRLWRTIEERRTLQASVAHDLRNPLAIMAGYVEYLRQNRGALTGEQTDRALRNLEVTTARMERYTEYIRDLDAIEDTEVRPAPAALPGFLQEAADSLRVLAAPRGLRVTASFDVPACTVELDRAIFYRVLENVFSNAVRYAEKAVVLRFTLTDSTLAVRVTDDGRGFSPQMLRKKNSLYYSEDVTGGHLGLGLATGKILCGKHGGGLKLSNSPGGGACVEIAMAVKPT